MDLSKAEWRKSSYTSSNGGDCVEVAGNLPDAIAVRDSKDRGGPALAFSRSAWSAFLGAVKSGAFD